jgi:PAS domain-containing protein
LDGCLLEIHSEVHIERHLDNDKNERWFQWFNRTWYGDKENILGIILSIEDVSERIQNELKLEKLEVLFKEKTEIGKIGHWEYDAEKNELFWCNITKAINTGKHVNGRIPLLTAKGNNIWVLAAGQPIIKDKVFVGLIGTFQDIMDIVRAEAKIIENERLLRTVLDNLPLNAY